MSQKIKVAVPHRMSQTEQTCDSRFLNGFRSDLLIRPRHTSTSTIVEYKAQKYRILLSILVNSVKLDLNTPL